MSERVLRYVRMYEEGLFTRDEALRELNMYSAEISYKMSGDEKLSELKACSDAMDRILTASPNEE